MPQLWSRASEMPDEQAKKLWSKVAGKSSKCTVSECDGLDSMKVYAAIKELVEETEVNL